MDSLYAIKLARGDWRPDRGKGVNNRELARTLRLAQGCGFNVYPLLKHSVLTPFSATVNLFQHLSPATVNHHVVNTSLSNC